MKNEKENKNMYKETFDEVHASENLLGKVKDMKRENVNIVKRISKKAACAAAALAVVGFISSNAIVYAATGSTWVEKVKVSFDGKQYEAEIQRIDENTAICRIGSDEDESEYGYSYGIAMDGDAQIVISDGRTGAFIKCENDRLYLVSGDDSIDITDDFNGGICEGDMVIGGKECHYTVTSTDSGVYGLSITEK